MRQVRGESHVPLVLFAAAATLVVLVLVLVPAAASARPAAQQGVLVSLPSWKQVCEVIEPVEKYHMLDALEALTEKKEFGTLGMILMFTKPALCPTPSAGRNLLIGQNLLEQQLFAGSTLFSPFKSQLGSLAPLI